MRRHVPTGLKGFITDERGMITHLALTVMVLVLLFAGLSVDTSNARRVRGILQIAADSAAHAGVMELPNKAKAKNSALELAKDNLDQISSSFAITSSSIEFGSWDKTAKTFTPKGTPRNAIRVTAVLSSANAHPVPTFFLRLAGLKSWDVAAQSVAYRSTTDCASADITAMGRFEVTSNNDFYNGFCVEAAGGLKMSRNNQFDDDNKIYVKSMADVQLPGASSLSTVVGRGTAKSSASLTYGDVITEKSTITPSYTSDITTLASNYIDPYYSGQPSYINTSASVIQLNARDVKYTTFTPGRIYHVNCGGSRGSKAQFYTESDVRQIVMVSDCKIQLGKKSSFKDVVMVSKSTDQKSVYAASKVKLGDDDHCAVGGGVSIYTAGGFSSAAKMEANGLYISAAKNVKVAANSDGIAGISIDAGGDVKFSAQAKFGTCKTGFSGSTEVSYLLVK